MRRCERKLPRHLSACLPVSFPPLHQLGFTAYCSPYLKLRTSGTGEWVVTGFVLEEKEGGGGGGGGGDRVHGIRGWCCPGTRGGRRNPGIQAPLRSPVSSSGDELQLLITSYQNQPGGEELRSYRSS
ncbi:hypothetical protein GOODEAATRI_000968 [Goodea atripinnis]|uniref:Uncharacterized protein n=1 Tax=Goodea atripinnis TaxID=208336 RepID=A0ABV0ME16_9TELE